MKYLILVTDIVFRFRIVAIELNIAKPNTWERRVMTIQEVTDLLLSLHCIDPAAARFLDEGTEIVPHPGLRTVPLSETVPLIEMVDPEFESVSIEAQDALMIVTQADTTEEMLAGFGFSLQPSGPLQ